MTNGSKDRVVVTPRMVRQETFVVRGRSTCFPASIVNAAIAIGALSAEHAQLYHQAIIDELVSIPELWNGMNIRIQTFDPRIPDIVESYLPVVIGHQEADIGRLLTVSQSYRQIYRGLANGEFAYVIQEPNRKHAHAAVYAVEGGIVTVDPFDPQNTSIRDREEFNRYFSADGNGWVIVTPVAKRS